MSSDSSAHPEPAHNAPPGDSWRKGFWSLIVTQFQGAFSDNALKNLTIFLIVGLGLTVERRDFLISSVEAIFSIPFILFSMFGGYLADRHSKRSVMLSVKFLEVAIMTFATVGLAARNLEILLGAVFLMGVHSALFGPSKYGILPELLPQKFLSWGNGILELGTMLAIITGLVAGGFLAEVFRTNQVWSGAILLALAGLGIGVCWNITKVPPADPAKPLHVNPFSDLLSELGRIRRDRVLYLAVIGNTYFWFLAALLRVNIVLYGTDVLHASELQSGYLLGAIAVGIGLGSAAAGSLSGRKIEYGLIPLGSAGLTVFGIMLSSTSVSYVSVLVILGLLGFSSGFFIVPINALLQHRPGKGRKGAVLGAANLLSFVGVFIAMGVINLLRQVGRFDPPTIFLVSAIITVVGTLYVLVLLPDALLRFVLWMFTHSVYRIKVAGRDNIPEKGGALFVCNHLSLVDALLLSASTDRPIRFIMFKGIYDMLVVKPFARILRAIPISAQLRPREMLLALQTASDAIRHGEVVCIFAEGQITRIGQLLPFRRGFVRIMKDVRAPIIPVCLDGVWGSIFSYERRRFIWKLPRRLGQPVTVTYGAPMRHDAAPVEVRQAVQELNTRSWPQRRRRMKMLHRSFIQTARNFPLRFAMADARVKKLRFGMALTRTIFLSRRLRSLWSGQEMVGILLPPSVAGALVNLSAIMMGKIPVNLNYTASNEVIASCARQCNLRTVVTSGAFLEHVPVKVPGTSILVENVVANPGRWEKIGALAMTWLFPARFLERALGRSDKGGIDDVATVIFSSGSTGDPKGVMLTHYNIASNIQQLGQIFSFRRDDRFLGILPFFHSFGFTATTMVPATLGVGVVFHANPFETQAIGELVRDYAVTFLMATPTMLQAYTRRVEPELFGSLQFVMAGAEKMPERIAQAFDDTFGIRPLEGYGCTECSPVVTVNTHDYRAAGFRQVGAKRGKIGHPLPGISIRIVDPDSMHPLPVDQSGLMLVSGPNVMKGYLNLPGKTAEVLCGDWYVTGDIASMDADGFVQITDRMSRFSKIGGEMVPHIRVEEVLQDLSGDPVQVFAVAAVADQSKGERLIVLHTLNDEKIRSCLEKLQRADLPNLWKPRPDQFIRIDALPYLGSGKLDLRKVRELAGELAGAGGNSGR